MREVFIDHLTFQLGDETFSVDKSAEEGRTVSTSAVLKESGFNTHHICRQQTSAYDLARDAVRQIEPNLGDVGAIIYSTCIP
ncbi:MAG TPA: hypothetical protein VN743_01585, partial [Blastocatellia bacterium]|nr:hypothetical protein [Blastocatellia bacterium]